MNFKNFETHIAPHILERGAQYYLDGAVTALNYFEGTEQWLAIVKGTEQYEVQIEGKKEIRHWHCTCPYDRGPLCKHVAAVLFAIQVHQASNRKTGRKRFATDVDQIFSKAGPEELLDFFRNHLPEFPQLESKLLTAFAQHLKGSGKGKYEKLIKQYIRSARGRHGFIDYGSSSRLGNQIYQLTRQGMDALEKGKPQLAFQIAAAVIDTFPAAFEAMDDSSGEAGFAFRSAAELLASTLEATEAPELQGEIFEFLLKMAEKRDDYSRLLDADLTAIELLAGRDWDDGRNARVEAVIRNAIKRLKKEEYGELLIPDHLEKLVTFYQLTGRTEKAAALRDKHLDIPDLRANKIEELLAAGQTEAARICAEEGLELAKDDFRPDRKSRWLEYLVLIARLTGDRAAERARLRELYLANSHSEEVYEKWKGTFTEAEWPAAYATLIETVRQKSMTRWGFNPQHLAILFRREQQWSDLLKLLQESEDPHLIQTYGPELAARFPDETFLLYEQYFRQQAQLASNRRQYRELARQLKKVKKLPGGAPFTERLIEEFIATWPRRPAMKEELKKI